MRFEYSEYQMVELVAEIVEAFTDVGEWSVYVDRVREPFDLNKMDEEVKEIISFIGFDSRTRTHYKIVYDDELISIYEDDMNGIKRLKKIVL